MNQIEKTNQNKVVRIFQEVVERYVENAPVPVQFETLAIQPAINEDFRPDLKVRVKIQGRTLEYYAEIKDYTKITTAGRFLLNLKKVQLNHPVLLMTQYVNPKLADELMRDKIEFIDAAGNLFINQPPLFIFIKGNRFILDFRKHAVHWRAFKPMGIRILYAFLCNPGLENKAYREIAAFTGVALGTVGWTMYELKEQGFLIDINKQKKLIRKNALLEKWVAAYAEQLRPKQILGRFKGEHDWWKAKNLDPLKDQWGGEVAANKLTHYLNPQIITIYTEREYLNQFLLDNRLKRDEKGEIEILERFWKIPQPVRGEFKDEKIWNYDDIVNPILVYADLIATGDQRNAETAKLIYDEYLIRFIQ